MRGFTEDGAELSSRSPSSFPLWQVIHRPGRGAAAEMARKGGTIICFLKCPDWICKFSSTCDAFMTTIIIIIPIYSAALTGNNTDVSKQ